MKFYIKNLAPLLFTLAIVCLPLVTIAAENTFPGGYQSPPNTVSGGQTTVKLTNPLEGKANNFCDLIKIVLQAILVIGLPIAVVFLVYVGFKFITAQGKPEAIKEAQHNFLNTVIGIAIFLGAWTIAEVIAATLKGLGASAVNSC